MIGGLRGEPCPHGATGDDPCDFCRISAGRDGDHVRPLDMYGNRIHPIGETGYGVSLTLQAQAGGGEDAALQPMFALFHISDGFRQCLFTFALVTGLPTFAPWAPRIANASYERIAELMESQPHGTVGEYHRRHA